MPEMALKRISINRTHGPDEEDASHIPSESVQREQTLGLLFAAYFFFPTCWSRVLEEKHRITIFGFSVVAGGLNKVGLIQLTMTNDHFNSSFSLLSTLALWDGRTDGQTDGRTVDRFMIHDSDR